MPDRMAWLRIAEKFTVSLPSGLGVTKKEPLFGVRYRQMALLAGRFSLPFAKGPGGVWLDLVGLAWTGFDQVGPAFVKRTAD